ncbi:MAG TPA: MFS transporter, partial [Acidobacteriaceae bacterium]
VLPLLTRQWSLSDASSGLLPAAQFLGIFIGSMTVSSKLQRSFVLGSVASTLGFACFALSSSWSLSCIALLAGCWGLGQVMTSTNLILGARYTVRRGAALASFNFVWGLGAILSPLLIGWLSPFIALSRLLVGFAVLFGLVALVSALEPSDLLRPADENAVPVPSSFRLPMGVFLFFAACFVLYGGFEASMNVWITTYMFRYGGRSLFAGQTAATLFWISLTAGRGIASLLMLYMSERTLQRAAIIASACTVAALILVHGGAAIAICTVMIGLSASVIFPVICSQMMSWSPGSRQAGTMMAVSSLGNAAWPWMIGVASQYSSSLRIAFVLPLIAICSLWLLTGRSPVRPAAI